MPRLIACCLILVACRSGTVDGAAVDRCRELGDGVARAGEVEVWVESRVGRGAVRPGRVPRCLADPAAARLLVGALEARQRLPDGLDPGLVVIHLSPQLLPQAPTLEQIDYHRPSHTIWVAREAVAEIDQSVWLHELAHLRMRAHRPADPVAAQLIDAVEEAAADYLAAIVSGSPRLGRGSRARRLDRDSPLPIRWEALALPGSRFDSHRAGQQLAAALWRERDPALAADLLECLRGARFFERGVGAAIDAVIAACPVRSGPRISRELRNWLPASLR